MTNMVTMDKTRGLDTLLSTRFVITTSVDSYLVTGDGDATHIKVVGFDVHWMLLIDILW